MWDVSFYIGPWKVQAILPYVLPTHQPISARTSPGELPY